MVSEQSSPAGGVDGGGGVQVAGVRREEGGARHGLRQPRLVRLLEQAGTERAQVAPPCR